jgi:Phosphotransferase enzyme family
MLDVDSAAPFLLDAGLVAPALVVDGDLTVRSVVGRNRNLRVEGPRGRGYFIKQPDLLDGDGALGLRREAEFYQFCRGESALARLVPGLRYYDPGPPLLVLDLFGDAPPLGQRLGAGGAEDASCELAREVGAALALVHRTFRDPTGGSGPGWLLNERLTPLSGQPPGSSSSPDLGPDGLPAALRLRRPGPELLRTISPAAREVLAIVQNAARLSEQLDRLRALWRPETLIHNDIKSENVLTLPSGPGVGGTPERVRLVDWEFIRVGDPAWDVAGALQDVLRVWVESMPLGESVAVEDLTARARYPLPTAQRALRALWQGYRHGSGLAQPEADRLLLRAVTFSAARLIQTAYELAPPARAVPAESVLFLQLGANILSEPEAAQVRLYGIPRSLA